MDPRTAALQEEYLRRRKMNTYEERRKEGRTIHTKASRTALVVASLSLIFGLMAIVLPNWRSSWVGLIGYGTRRNWGLLYVQGRHTTFHHDMYDKNCKWYGHLMLGNSCLSPICRWYLLKCNVYFELCMYSYCAALTIIFGTLVQMLCLYWTVALSPRTLRWAANWYPIAALLIISGTVFWVIMTEGLFDQLNEESWYPVPPPGLSFMLSCANCVGILVNSYMAYTLHYMWPEVDPDDPMQFDSGSEGSGEELDSDDEKKKAVNANYGDYGDQSYGYGYGAGGGGEAVPAPAPVDSAQYAQPAQTPPPAVPERQWVYKDSSGQMQGPYPSSTIISWCSQGMFGGDIMIRATDETEFFPLEDGARIRERP